MDRWQNKVAVVTGASSGIGAACVKALLDNGMVVVGLARRLERMDTELRNTLPVDQQKRFHAHSCDVSQEEDIVKAFAWVQQHLGGVDVLVNNAGVSRRVQLVADNNTADLKDTVNTNILGVAFCTREAFRSMKQRCVAGHVVIINSVLGHKIPFAPELCLSIYPATKHAVTAMTEVLRQEFLINQTKIKVSSVSPGVVDTEMIPRDDDFPKFPMLHAKDIADAVVYCIQTPPHVQIHEIIVKPVGETLC